MANMVIDMWHHDTQNQQEIVRMLRQIIYGIAFFFADDSASFSDLLEKTTVILGRDNAPNNPPTISFKQIKRFFVEAEIEHQQSAERQQLVRSFS